MSNDLEKALATVAKGAGVIFIGLIIGNLLGMVNTILLARFLGVEVFGLFTLAFSLVSIATTFAVFGLSGAIPRFIPFHLEKEEKDTVKSTVRFSLGFVLCTSITIGLIMFILSGKLSVDIFHEKNLHIILKYVSLGLPLVALPNVLEAIIRGFKAVKYKLLIYDVGGRLIKIIVFIPLLALGYRLSGAIVAYYTSMIVIIFSSIFIVRKKLFPDHLEYRKVPIAKNLLLFSVPLALTGMTFLFVSQTDVILLGYFLTSKEIGIYVPALAISELLIFVGVSFGYIFLPVISGLFAKRNIDDIETLFKSASKWMFLIVLPLFVYILLFPKEIITLLYGFEYSKGYLALVILASGISMNIFTGLTGSILVGGGHTKLNLACEVIAAITNVSLNIVLIPMYGVIGAAIGTSFSYFTRNLFSLAFVYKTTKMHPYNKDYLKIISVGAIVLGFVYMTKIFFVNLLSWLILMILLGFLLLVLFTGLILITHCLDKNDKLILRALERKIGLKLNFLRKFI